MSSKYAVALLFLLTSPCFDVTSKKNQVVMTNGIVK